MKTTATKRNSKVLHQIALLLRRCHQLLTSHTKPPICTKIARMERKKTFSVMSVLVVCKKTKTVFCLQMRFLNSVTFFSIPAPGVSCQIKTKCSSYLTLIWDLLRDLCCEIKNKSKSLYIQKVVFQIFLINFHINLTHIKYFT